MFTIFFELLYLILIKIVLDKVLDFKKKFILNLPFARFKLHKLAQALLFIRKSILFFKECN